MSEHSETLKWKGFTIMAQGEPVKLNCAIVGMAVGGDETQIIIANDIGQIRAVVWKHEDGSFTWINPPDKPEAKEAIEQRLAGIYRSWTTAPESEFYDPMQDPKQREKFNLSAIFGGN
jgi:hypothetical protein